MKKLLIIVSLLAVIGCKGQQGPQGPAGADGTDGTDGADGGGTYIYGEVDNTGKVGVLVLFSSVIPWVTVNQETLNVDYCDGLGTEYEDSISVSNGDSLHLKVYTDGIATASARVPGSFEITSHDTSQTVYIPKDSALTVSWSSANYCDFYRVDFYFSYGYYDTLGDYTGFHLRVDTCVTSTSITFPASRLFPAYVDSIDNSWGSDFDVQAMNGPKLEPGSKGNVIGNGSGFFWGSADGGDLDIRVEGAKGKAQKEISREELRHRWFEKAKAIDPNYQALKEEFQRVP